MKPYSARTSRIATTPIVISSRQRTLANSSIHANANTTTIAEPVSPEKRTIAHGTATIAKIPRKSWKVLIGCSDWLRRCASIRIIASLMNSDG